jgi:hypothetical protein
MVAILTAFVVLRVKVDGFREQYAGMYFTDQLTNGLEASVRWGNQAIWIPIALFVVTAWLLIRWIRNPWPSGLNTLIAVTIIDLASVAAFVDVDTRTYERKDLLKTPALAEAIETHHPRPGERLLVPRFAADYDRPLEVLWPQTNLKHGIATFNAYGPFVPYANRMLHRFMPWGSSEEILTLLRRPDLMRSMGIRFIAVRTEEERALLEAAMLPATGAEAKPVAGTVDRVPVIARDDVLWPIHIDAPGVYELSLNAEAMPGSSSRMFIRLETQVGGEIGRTRAIEPADLAAGPRRLRFMFHCEAAPTDGFVRIKSEKGEAAWVSEGTIRCVASGEKKDSVFVHLANVAENISLYELPGTAPLVRALSNVRTATDLISAVEMIQSDPPAPDTGILVGESVDPPPTTGRVDFQRPTPNEIRAQTGPGVIVINESYDPGWRATLDGRPTEIIRTNAVCQAIPVTGDGLHSIRLTYRPRGLTAGLILSLATAFALLLGLARTGRRDPT